VEEQVEVMLLVEMLAVVGDLGEDESGVEGESEVGDMSRWHTLHLMIVG
jgi:hypothetical protein